jgi:hypothetical protein
MDYCKKGPGVAASGAKDNFSFIVSKTTYTVNKLPDFFTRKMTAAAQRLAAQGLAVTLAAIGTDIQSRDPFYIPDVEKAFLSAIPGGGDYAANTKY